MHRITVSTQKNNEVIDITSTVEDVLSDQDGLCHVFITHTTAALTTADLDPGTDLDMLDAWNEMVPDLNYRHPHDPSHVGDHIMASTIGPSVIVPCETGKLLLGKWQRLVLVEFDGPRDREVVINEIH